MNFVTHLEKLISAKKSLIKDTYALFVLEAKLAKLSVYPLILSFVMLLPLLISLWLLCTGLLGWGLLALVHHNVYLVLAILLVLHVLILVLLLRNCNNKLKTMSFAKTRSVLSAS